MMIELGCRLNGELNVFDGLCSDAFASFRHLFHQNDDYDNNNNSYCNYNKAIVDTPPRLVLPPSIETKVHNVSESPYQKRTEP